MELLEAAPARLAYEERGSGEPVLFLHGAGFDRRLWEPQIERLRSSHRCIAVDLRGHGATTSRDKRPVQSVQDLADDVLGLLDSLQIERADLVGLSLGGLVAYAFAARHPERTRSIVTMGAPADMPSGPVNAVLLAAQKRWLYALLAQPGQARYNALQKRWSKRPEVKQYLASSSGVTDAAAFRPVWEGCIRFRGSGDLPRITTPALVMIGTRDLRHNRKHARRAAELIPGARLEVIEDAGHILNRDAEDRVNNLLEAWLSGG